MLIKEKFLPEYKQRNPFADILEIPEREQLTPELVLVVRYLSASYEMHTFVASGEESDDQQLAELEQAVEKTGADLQVILETLKRETLVSIVMTLLLHLSNNTSVSVLLEFLNSDFTNEWTVPISN